MTNAQQHLLEETLKKLCLIKERSDNPLIKANRLGYIRFPREDLAQATQFFVDFGLLLDCQQQGKAYLRSIDNSNHIIILDSAQEARPAIGLVVDEYKSLEVLAQYFGTEIQSRDCPLGGQYVVLNDPDGNLVEINHGLNSLGPIEVADSFLVNTPQEHPRLNDTVRLNPNPSSVARLGHTAFAVAKLEDSIHWYQDTLGVIVSDFQMLPNEPVPTIAFLRCDNGSKPTDHHTLAIGSAIEIGHLHTAFEVADIDEIGMGGEWLKTKKYTHSWGIGRHILGSQIFDYWRDPWGFQFEHYSDGDLFDNTVPTGYELFDAHAEHQWGPDITDDFLGKKFSFSLLKVVVMRLLSNDDFTFRRLRTAIKAMSQ